MGRTGVIACKLDFGDRPCWVTLSMVSGCPLNLLTFTVHPAFTLRFRCCNAELVAIEMHEAGKSFQVPALIGSERSSVLSKGQKL